MATLLAPYVNSMKLGSGFNSFTQELCIDNAVTSDDPANRSRLSVLKSSADQLKTTVDSKIESSKPEPVAQSVTYMTKVIDKVTDVTDALDVNAAFAVKYDNLSAKGQGKFINTNKLKESDLTFMISCKVVNQTIMDHSLTKFSPINGVETGDFTQLYGDSFISGFQEGGEFTALISIKVKDQSQRDSIIATAKIDFTGSEKFTAEGTGDLNKSRDDLLNENETTISVSWTGGGQELKSSTDDWTFATMRVAALKFPELVAKCPVRTHAILTKYTSLKSFTTISAQFQPLSYEHARLYTTALQDAYMDYKNIAKNLQTLAFDVASGLQALSAPETDKDFSSIATKASSPALLQDMTNSAETGIQDTTTAPLDASISNGSIKDTEIVSSNPETSSTDATELVKPAKALDPLVIAEAYPATLFGLEAARLHCRFMMNRIISEVDAVTKHPQIAQDELRPLPYMSPYLFMQLLPVGRPVARKVGLNV